MLSQETINIIKSTVPVLEQHGKTITTVFYKNMFEAHPELLKYLQPCQSITRASTKRTCKPVYAAAAKIDNLGAVLPAVVQVAHKHKSLDITQNNIQLSATTY